MLYEKRPSLGMLNSQKGNENKDGWGRYLEDMSFTK